MLIWFLRLENLCYTCRILSAVEFFGKLILINMTKNRSPFAIRGFPAMSPGRLSESDTDISFISSSRPSTDRTSSVFYNYMDPGRTSRLSTSSDSSFGSFRSAPKFTDLSLLHDVSFTMESDRTSCSWSSQGLVCT